jgi:excisionase family DNA binding protein
MRGRPEDPREAERGRTILVRPSEAAALLAISPRHLWSLAVSGEIPSLKVGRARRYVRSELEAWVAERAAKGRR